MYLYISLYENLFENGCIYIYIYTKNNEKRKSSLLLRYAFHRCCGSSGIAKQGRIQDFFRRGCTHLLLYTSTPINHTVLFFCRIPVVLENRRSSQGGVRTPCTLPLDPPLQSVFINLLRHRRNCNYNYNGSCNS